MKSIGDELKDMRAIQQRAAEPVRKYERKVKINVKRPDRARFKLKVWFLDNNSKVFYSFDLIKKPDNSFQLDEWNGLMKLMRLLNFFGKKMKVAIIYANLEKYPDTRKTNYDTEVTIYKNGKIHESPYVFFDPETNELNIKMLKAREIEKRNALLQAQKQKLNSLNEKNRKS